MSQETSIGSLNNMNDEDSKLVESILNDLNGPENSQQPQQQQQHPQQQELSPEQIKAIQMQRQMAMQQQQQQLMAQQQQIAQQQRAAQQKVSTQENIIETDTSSLIDNIKKESKSIILVVILSFLMSIDKVNDIFRMAPTVFISEDGSINLQAALIKSLVLGVAYYLIKTYLF